MDKKDQRTKKKKKAPTSEGEEDSFEQPGLQAYKKENKKNEEGNRESPHNTSTSKKDKTKNSVPSNDKNNKGSKFHLGDKVNELMGRQVSS